MAKQSSAGRIPPVIKKTSSTQEDKEYVIYHLDASRRRGSDICIDEGDTLKLLAIEAYLANVDDDVKFSRIEVDKAWQVIIDNTTYKGAVDDYDERQLIAARIVMANR